MSPPWTLECFMSTISVFVDIRELFLIYFLIIFKSKRMMSDKQDRYREYVVSNLIKETRIEYTFVPQRTIEEYKKGDLLGRDEYKQLTMHTPFNQKLFMVSSPKFRLPILKPFDTIPANFYKLMEEYAIREDEAQEVWKEYTSRLNKMVDFDQCRVLREETDQKTL